MLGKICVHLGQQAFSKECASTVVDLAYERILFGVAALLPRFFCLVPQKSLIENQVDILGKALDEVEPLREARAALEGE